MIFEKQVSIEIGRQLVKLSAFSDLKRGVTFVILQICGSISMRKALSIILEQGYWQLQKENKMVYYHSPLIYSSLKNLLNLLFHFLVVVPCKWNYLLYLEEND